MQVCTDPRTETHARTYIREHGHVRHYIPRTAVDWRIDVGRRKEGTHNRSTIRNSCCVGVIHRGYPVDRRFDSIHDARDMGKVSHDSQEGLCVRGR